MCIHASLIESITTQSLIFLVHIVPTAQKLKIAKSMKMSSAPGTDMDLTIGELLDLSLGTDAAQMLIDQCNVNIQTYSNLIKQSKKANTVVRSFQEYLSMAPELMEILGESMNENQFNTLSQFKPVIDSLVYNIFEMIV